MDADGVSVQYAKGLQGAMVIPNAKLWWPFTMSAAPAYLYTLQVSIVLYSYNRIGESLFLAVMF